MSIQENVTLIYCLECGDKLLELLNNEDFARELLAKARNINKSDPIKADIKRYRNQRINLDRKLEVLTERLSELPKEIAATSIYKKMETIQNQRKEIDETLELKARQLKGTSESPVGELLWAEFLKSFKELFVKHLSSEEQAKLIKKLIYRIELGSKEVKIHYFVGEDYKKKAASSVTGRFFNYPENCSNNLTYGGACKT